MALYHVYADESRQNAHPYMLYGMVIVPFGKPLEDLSNAIARLREEHKYGEEEVKWQSVSRQKLDLYRRIVDTFFDDPMAQFCCMSIEKAALDLAKYHAGDHEAAFYWGYGMTLSRNLAPAHNYEIFTDQRTNRRSNRTADLKAQINGHWIQKMLAAGERPREIVRDIKEVDSKKYALLQVADVLVGAVGYAMEGCDQRPGASSCAIALLQHITDRVGCVTLAEHQSRGTRFNVWQFRFREEERREEDVQRVAADS